MARKTASTPTGKRTAQKPSVSIHYRKPGRPVAREMYADCEQLLDEADGLSLREQALFLAEYSDRPEHAAMPIPDTIRATAHAEAGTDRRQFVVSIDRQRGERLRGFLPSGPFQRWLR